MEIKHHICFGSAKAPELLMYIQNHNVSYCNSNGTIIVDILESSPHWPVIHQIVMDRNIFCLSETLFTPEELCEAAWLRVRSKWNNGYPQPEGNFGYRRTTYTEESFCSECGSGLRQIAPFRLKVPPKWGKRHIMSLNWVSDELFVDDVAKNILTNSELTGFHFSCVYNKNGTVLIPDTYQLCIDEMAHPGFVKMRRDLQEVLVCPSCGREKYHISGVGKHAFYRGALESMPDICKTEEYFGWGKGADKLILIRQRAYQVIVENRLNASLVFEPIELI